MSDYYPLPANFTGYGDMLQYLDRITCIDHGSSAAITNCAQGGGFFGIFILIAVFAMIFISGKVTQFKTSSCFLAATFITMFIAIFLRLASALSDTAVIVTIALFFIALGVAYKDRNS